MFKFFKKKKPIYIGICMECTPNSEVTKLVNESINRFKEEYGSLKNILSSVYEPGPIIHDKYGFIFYHEPTEDEIDIISNEILRGTIDVFNVPGYLPRHISFYKLIDPSPIAVEGWIDWDEFKKERSKLV